MLLVCYPRCSTCKKAQQFLDDNGISYQYRDIKADRPTAKELKEWHSASGLPLSRFYNTSGQLYRELGVKDRREAMIEEEQYALLATDGMLVKRPLLIGDGFVLTGFRQSEWEARLSI